MDVAFVKIRLWSVVVGEKFVFYEAYEEVGVVVVTKQKTVYCENQFS